MQVPGTFTWRMLATVLGGQSLVIFFGALVARGLSGKVGSADANTDTGFLVMCGIAVLAIVAAGMMRRPGGVLLGWLVQVLSLVSAIWVPMMLLVGLIFGALWVGCLVKGRQVDAEMARRRAETA